MDQAASGRAGCCASFSCVVMRARSTVRPSAVNFQLNGRAVLVVAADEGQQGLAELAGASKSLGVRTFFWMMEKKISTWLSQDATWRLEGSNGTLPTTSITAPAAGSVIANPGAKPVTAAGRAQPGSTAPVTTVNVAVQMNGPAGQWWNAAKRTWQAGPTWHHATLSGSGGTINWTLGVPVPAQGSVLTFSARAVRRWPG